MYSNFSVKILVRNKKAHFEYQIIKTFEAGIVLTGFELKSILAHHINIEESYVKSRDNELYIFNAHISKYKYATDIVNLYSEFRDRKLLLHKKEIQNILDEMKLQRYAVIPLKIYLGKSNKVKVEIALALGKKKYDKRQALMKKDNDRDKRDTLKYSFAN